MPAYMNACTKQVKTWQTHAKRSIEIHVALTLKRLWQTALVVLAFMKY